MPSPSQQLTADGIFHLRIGLVCQNCFNVLAVSVMDEQRHRGLANAGILVEFCPPHQFLIGAGPVMGNNRLDQRDAESPRHSIGMRIA